MRATFAIFILLFCCPDLFSQTTKPIPYGDNPSAGKFYNLNGFRMYTEVYGSGPALLMIHGNSGSMKAFSHNAAFFSAHHTVILADSRSQGKSVDPDHPLTFEMMADDFSDLLDAMHIASADVIGFSDGGINALLLAIRHPGKVQKLVSTGANLWPTADAFRPGLWESDQAREKALKDKPRTTAEEQNSWKLFMLDQLEPHITLDQLHTIENPCLIVCGDHDLISIDHTVLIYRNIKHANLWVVPDSGHATLIEHVDQFNATAEEFFTRPFKDHR